MKKGKRKLKMVVAQAFNLSTEEATGFNRGSFRETQRNLISTTQTKPNNKTHFK